MKLAARMTVEEVRAHLKERREYLMSGWFFSDPQYGSGVIARNSLKQAMQRRKSVRKPNADI